MKNRYFIKLVVLFLPFCAVSQTASQLTVTPNSVATQLAQIITGSGVTVSGAALNCGAGGSGTFSYPASGTTFSLGLTGGILLTTGHAADAASFAQIVSVSTGNNFSDPDLTAISTHAKYDNCILTFSFVPVCNQINITSVFGSSEYDGYQCSTYNDVFGIFLTGPNPSGGNYTATNIATLPSGTPITINNINDGSAPCTSASNPTYYQANYTGTEIVYEGMTTAITSVKPVIPCSTYFMKIAIADADDEAYDSGVFIGGNSVSCSTAPSAFVTSTPVSCGGSNGTASITTSNYTATPTYSWSPGGQTTPSISGLSAGTYTCQVGFLTGCSGVYTQTLITTISNPTSFSLSTATNPAVCSGNATGSATVSISGGSPPYSITWATTPTHTTSMLNNLLPGTYSVTVLDNAGCSQTTAATVGITNPTVLTFTTTSVCGNNAVLNANTGSSYQWYDTLSTIITGATAQTYTANNVLNNQHYIVSYKDNTTGCRDSVEITISKTPLTFNYNVSPACHGGNNGSIDLNPSGTFTATSYNWVLTGASSAAGTATTTPISISGLGAGNYTVAVNPTGNPSCSYTYSMQIVQNVIPSPSLDTVKVCNLDTLRLNPPVSAGSTNNWYKSPPSLANFIGSSAANIAYPIPPPQNSGITYVDSIKSAAGCLSVYKETTVIESFQTAVTIMQQLKCYNDTIGIVKITAPRETNGPIGKPFTFTWVYPSPYASPALITAGSSSPVSSTESNLHAGSYYCIIKSGNCTDTAKFSIINPPKLPTDSIYAYYCPKDSLGLLVADTGFTQYAWHPSNTGASVTGDSIHVPVQNINSYYVTYTRSGCRDTAKAQIHITTHNAFVPNEMVNVFSPNGDNSNDFFYPFYQRNLTQYEIAKQSNKDVYELKIYDRWGILVFETNDYASPWDGKNKNGHEADAGTYFFYVKYESNCATNADKANKKGFIELVR